MKHDVRTGDRMAAFGALALGLVAFVLGLEFILEGFPRGLAVFTLLLIAAFLALHGVIGAGPVRIAGLAGAAIAVIIAIAIVAQSERELYQAVGVIVLAALVLYLARRALRVRVPLPDAAAPERAVLFFNPKSGGGKAEEHSLAEEARARGIRPVELTPDSDLEELVRAAVADGADGLAMAGGDGSQAVVAAICAEEDLPYACVPAGTRNHFALDLGVDREDVTGALDAFVDAGEKRVDLGEVNGRVFVNNVSLGLYAEAVQKDGYRDAKLKTLLEVIPETLGSDGDGPLFEWRSPSGRLHSSGAAILVSNNRYRIGKAIGSGTRPRIDDGRLGIAVLTEPVTMGGWAKRLQKPWRDWSATEFKVDADGPVAAGIDGEAFELGSPLEFRIRPATLRVRIARRHPGASPSAAIPDGNGRLIMALARIALGRPPGSVPVNPAVGQGDQK